jgi:PAS domain-containing protein
MDLPPIPTDVMERLALARDIALRYPVAYSDVDNGELYWGLCAAIVAVDKALAERDALRAEVGRLSRLVYEIETRCDPAGETQERVLAVETATAALAEAQELRAENAKLRAALEAAPLPLGLLELDGNGDVVAVVDPEDPDYHNWYMTTRAEALRRE